MQIKNLKKSKSFYFFYILAIQLILLLLLEGSFRFANFGPPEYTYSQNPYLISSSEGYHLKPNLNGVLGQVTQRGKVLSQTLFSTDVFGRRTDAAQEPFAAEKHLILFGCSYVFGEGLQWPETLSAQIESQSHNWKTYSYAASGYGPQQMWANLRRPDFPSEIAEPNGLGIYVYIPDHVNRVSSSLKRASPAPKLILKENHLELQGLQNQFSPGVKFLSWLLKESYLLQFLNIDFQTMPQTDRENLLCQTILESSKSYQQRFPGSKFLVALAAPDSSIVSCLQKIGVPRLDAYEGLANFPSEQLYQADQLHLTPAANAVLAKSILKGIEDLK